MRKNRAYFRYKGIDSRDMYLYIVNDISFPSPEADIEFVEVLGRDGELAIDNERLKSINFSLPLQLKLPKNMHVEYMATQISNWLKSDMGWHSLSFSGSEDYEYIALCYEQFNIQQTLTNYGKTIINFKLKPYKKLKKESLLKLENGSILQNQQHRESKPLLKIKGNGDIELKNNDKDWLKLRGVDREIIVDSELMSVYKGNRPEYDKMISTITPMFPILYPGCNKITWEGNVEELEILPRWVVIV